MIASKPLHRISGIRPLAIALFFALALALLAVPSSPVSGAEEKKILLFFSQEAHNPAIIALNQGVPASLSRGSPDRIQFYNEYLDQFRLPEERYRQQLLNFLRLKYADQKIDLIIAMVNPSLTILAG